MNPEKLEEALGKLSTRQAAMVARGIETERALGRETLPTEAILAALRPQLRAGQSARVPTLCRLACAGFEEFLGDRVDAPRPPGLIARAVIAPWWQALQRLNGKEISVLEEELKRQVAANDPAALVAFGGEVASAVRGWTETLLQRLADRKPDPALKRLFADPLLVADLQQILHILPLGPCLHGGVDAVLQAAARHGQARGRRLADLGPEVVTEAKAQYQRISERFGLGARYFALALLNRLDRPWAMLRLGRALSWKANDALVRDTEFGIIGERLVAELVLKARALAALASSSNAVFRLDELTRSLVDYMDEAEGLLGEFGFRRDSAWGEAILQTRGSVAQALGGRLIERLVERVLQVLPQRPRPGARRALAGPDLETTPERAQIREAVAAARCLDLLVKRGVRHGFAMAARAAVERLDAEIERRAGELIAEARTQPSNPAIAAQIAAAAELCDVLFEGAKGDLLARRLRNAQDSAPRPDVYGVA